MGHILPPGFFNSIGLKVAVVAVGGAGIALVEDAGRPFHSIRKMMAIDSSLKTLRNSSADRHFYIRSHGQKPTSPPWAKAAASDHFEALCKELVDFHAVIVVAGMGGAAGTGIAPLVVRAARSVKAMTVVVALTPFDFESQERHRLARRGLSELAISDAVFPVSNRALAGDHLGDATLASTMEYSKTALSSVYWNTIGCLERGGLVGIDFEDVSIVLTADSSLSALGWGTAAGEKRAEQAVWNAIHHPLLTTRRMHMADGVMVSIRSAGSLPKMQEVGEIMTLIRRYARDDTHVIFSANRDDKLADGLTVSILAAGIEGKAV